MRTKLGESPGTVWSWESKCGWLRFLTSKRKESKAGSCASQRREMLSAVTFDTVSLLRRGPATTRKKNTWKGIEGKHAQNGKRASTITEDALLDEEKGGSWNDLPETVLQRHNYRRAG